MCAYQRLLASPNVGKAVDQIRLDLERTLVDHAEFNAIPDRCGFPPSAAVVVRLEV